MGDNVARISDDETADQQVAGAAVAAAAAAYDHARGSNHQGNRTTATTTTTHQRRQRPVLHYGITTWDSDYDEDEEIGNAAFLESNHTDGLHFDHLSDVKRHWENEVNRGGGRPKFVELQERLLNYACIDFLMQQVTVLPEMERLSHIDMEHGPPQIGSNTGPIREACKRFLTVNANSLKEFRLRSHNHQEDEEAALVYLSLVSCRLKNLEKLRLDFYRIRNRSAAGKFFQSYFCVKQQGARPSITHLALEDCRLNAKSVEALRPCFSFLHTLVINGQLKDNVAADLLGALAKEANCSIRCLDLRRNRLSKESLGPFAAFLNQHKYLQALKLGDNSNLLVDAQESGQLDPFVQAVGNHKGLHDLHLSGCYVSDESLGVLLKALERNTSLKTLDISWNYKVRHGDWVRSIPELTALQHFHVRGSLSRGSSRQERKLFQEAMHDNTSLVECDLANTGLEGLGCDRFLTRNKYLWKVKEFGSDPIPTLACWAPLLRLFGSVGESGLDPTFVFLRTKTVELANTASEMASGRKRRSSSEKYDL